MLQVAGRGGVPSSGAGSVLVNITAVTPGSTGTVTATPGGVIGGTAQLSFVAGRNSTTQVVVQLGSTGAIRLADNSPRSMHMVVDVIGWYRAGTATNTGATQGDTSARVFDTRTGAGTAKGAIPAGGTRVISVRGRAGIPLNGAQTAALSVTVAGPTGSGSLSVYRGDIGSPGSADINFPAGVSTTSTVIVPVAANGTIRVTNNSSRPVHVLADNNAHTLTGVPGQSSTLHSLTTKRIVDTRTGLGAPKRAVAPVASIGVQVAGKGGVPTAGVKAVVVNVIAVGPTRTGQVMAYQYGTSRPSAPTLSTTAGVITSNTVIVPVSAAGKITLTNNSTGSTHLVVEVSGWIQG
ncbi:hypothetical protein [Nakamurella alba]|uniref:hypothetical protein n=1 Tax=Nakamurella alba TaxID=2665158 RepID=UPI0018AC841D|nr:hypothetical protein [Nakamurella alba]